VRFSLCVLRALCVSVVSFVGLATTETRSSHYGFQQPTKRTIHENTRNNTNKNGRRPKNFVFVRVSSWIVPLVAVKSRAV